MKTYDFVVLGGGSAGYAAARTAADLGLETAVVDGARELGGLCILRGCMPSKALIESGNRALALRRAEEFGLHAGPLEVRAVEMQARKRALVEEFAAYRREQLASRRFELVRGTARFVGPHEIEVTPLAGGGSERIGLRSGVIATGSVVSRPPIGGLDEAGCWTSDDLLEIEAVPESVVVLGGGAIALEGAHLLGALGAEVTVIQRSPHLLSNLDPEVSEVLERSFRDRGIRVETDTRLEAVERAGARRRVRFTRGGESLAAEGAEVLLALGRRPNTGELDLGKAGVATDARGAVTTTADQRTSAPHLFAAGDVGSALEVVHLAIEQGEIAATNAAVLLGRRPPAARRSADWRLRLFGVFTHPEVASVGMTEREARATGRPVAAASYPFDDHGKSMVMGETEGFVKLVVDGDTREILGGTVVGPAAVELIHEIVVAMRFRATAGDLATTPHYHPTLSEIWTYPAEELA